MADQILSQEEIDALLSSMDKREIDTEETQTIESKVEPFNLTAQGIMLKEQFYALEEVYGKFSGLMSDSLSDSLQKEINVEPVTTKMMKFEDFIAQFPTPTIFSIFNMEPLIGSGLMAIESDLVFSLIDCMFGGNGKPLNKEKDFTPIELSMMSKFSNEMLANLELTWAIVYSVKISPKKMEINSEFIHIVDPSDLVIVIVFAITGEEFTGHIHVCLSYLMLEPIKEKLASRVTDDEMQFSWNSQLQDLLKEVTMKCTAELGSSTKQTVRDVLDLQKGDIIKLNTGPKDTVSVKIGGVPKYTGMAGIMKGNRAVKIITSVQNN